VEIRRLRKEDAHAAALLHMEGQPGTFLTSLGEPFLTAFYAGFGDSQWGYGFMAWDGDAPVGVNVGTINTKKLFQEFVLKRGLLFVWPVLLQVVRRPALLKGILQTFAYPRKMNPRHGEAETLFLGVTERARRQHIGSRLHSATAKESRRRGATVLECTVDKTNERANIYHVKRGFKLVGAFDIYGRTMNIYAMPLNDETIKKYEA
jgi:ribosomal protein S18 acetylase RimI-like enzyme